MSDDEGAIVLLPDNGSELQTESVGCNPTQSHVSQPQKKASSFTFVAACMAALGGLLFGYDIGIISTALPLLKTDFSLSCAEEEAVVSMMLVGALFASLVGGSLIDKIGSRSAIMVNAVIFIVGALILATSQSLTLLLAGRFVVGFAVALSAVSECIYISEIATPSNRGMLVSLNEVAITLGFLVAYLVGLIYVDRPHGWRYMFGLSVFPAAAQLLGMVKLPNSPHYLIMKHSDAEAEAAVRQLRRLDNSSEIRQEITNIRLSLESSRAASCWSLCSSADGLRSGMMISFGLVLGQQFTGQPNVLNYASTIFQQVGFCGDGLLGSSLPTVGLGVVKLLATLVSLLVIDRLGRRITLLSGAFVMALALVILSSFAFIQQEGRSSGASACSDNSTTLAANATDTICGSSDLDVGLRYTALIALMSYVAAYSFSFGPVTWLLLAELFPPSVKGRAVAISTSLNWAANLLISATFLRTVQLFTLGGVFLFYSVLTSFCLVFIFLAVPETSRRNLHRIAKELRTTTFQQRAIQHIAKLPCLRERFARRDHSVGGKYAQLDRHQSIARESDVAETAIQ